MSDRDAILTHYNLDMIIAVDYRVRSHRGTQFRQWATERLNEDIVKGFTIDDERLKEIRNLGQDYSDGLGSASTVHIFSMEKRLSHS